MPLASILLSARYFLLILRPARKLAGMIRMGRLTQPRIV
jgi:hypothetical protein